MSGFTTTSTTARKASAPPSALDIVSSQGLHNWDSLLSPSGDATLLPSTQDEAGLIDSPNFLLDASAASVFPSDLEISSSTAETFSWDSPAFSSGGLRPSAFSVGDLHTGSTLLQSGAQASASAAFNASMSMMSGEAPGFPGYPYGAFPLLPVLPTGPYDVQTGRSHLIPDDIPIFTVSPAAVSLSQVAPPRVDTPTSAATQIKPEPANETAKVTLRPREPSMDLDDEDEDVNDIDEDEEDMDDGDNGDEYRERSRGRKDGKLGRPASSAAPRKTDASSIDGSSNSVKRGKTTGSAKASGSEGGSTPAPKRRVGTRISVAEFVPPDVSGLSKREARLVKNRAAAFLSRQRKREEFELMEIRLTEVLEENARLKGDTTPGTPSSSSTDEVQRLQEMLREAKEREQALKSQLEAQTRMAENARIQALKAEEPVITVQEALKLAHSPMLQSPRSDISSLDGSPYTREKESSRPAHSGPGFNLMVLVFSLTLLSMPHQHQLQASMHGAGSQPTRIAYEPAGSSSATAFPSLFQNVLERWEGGSRFETVDDDEEMEVEVEPWEQEENESKSGSSYVVDFEMPVMADEAGKDDDGKIKVRISPCGVPRPRQNSGGLKPGELGWDGTPLPPLETNGVDLGSGAFAADWNSWGGWQQFLSDDLVGASGMLGADAMTGPVDDAFSPRSEMEHSVAQGTDENRSERWATPPPFTSGLDLDEMTSEGAKTPADATSTNAPVDVDVSLSALPAWSRAMVHAAAGEKLKARIRVSKKSKVAGRSKNTIALGKKRMGLVVKV